jgi:hypothetical protein
MKMNKLIYSIGILIILFLFTSCEKEDTLGLSKQTNYSVFTMVGDELIVMDKGATFADPGVSAKEGDADATVTITGTVDTSTGGIYKITYSAVNVDGYAASVARYVVVIDKAAVVGSDHTGAFERTFYGSPRSGTYSDWTKVNDWTYLVNDPGGVDDADYEKGNLTVYLVDATHVVVPIQKNELGGTIFCTSTKGGSSPDAIVTNGTKYIWSVKGAGYGTNLRTFEK